VAEGTIGHRPGAADRWPGSRADGPARIMIRLRRDSVPPEDSMPGSYLFSCVLLFLAVSPGARAAESPAAVLAERLWSISEVVLDRHIEAPARQEMFLAAVQGFYRAAETPAPADLAPRVSGITTK